MNSPTNNAPAKLRRLLAVLPLLLALFLLAGAPAQAETVTGTFRYVDYEDFGNLYDNVSRPIAHAKVEIWRLAPRFLGIWSWGMDRRVWTDANGSINVDMPWAAPGVVYALRVYAANEHMTVWWHDTPHVGESFYQETPEQTVQSPGQVLDFTHRFDELEAAQAYNIADAAWYAGEYVKHVYADLPTANAQTTDWDKTFYEPAGNTMQIYTLHAFRDATIIHEYGHFIQDQIGTLLWEPTIHSFCTVSDPGLAWMEGFAEYFELAVARTLPSNLLRGPFTSLESFSASDCSGATPRDSIEGVIAATLYDLVDLANEGHDWVADMDWYILSILDNELANSRPNIWDFRNAWQARGLNGRDLNRIYAQHGLIPHFQDADFVGQFVPAAMVAGRSYTVSVSMRNTGSTTWKLDQQVLGSQSPQDNLTWGLHRVSMGWWTAPPGEVVTFSFNVTAPATPGSYTFQWRMVQDGVGWFGATTPAVQVGVTAAVQSAQYVSQSVPGSMTSGGTYAVSVTMRNNGDTTWNPGTHFLGSQNPQDNLNWGLNRVALPAAVPPGGQVTFSFNVTAPSWGGSYGFQWRMLQNGIGWFGDTTPNVFVGVEEPPPTCSQTACSSECIASGCRGGSCMGNECFCMRCL
jgi:Ig-like domain from next to BRCA1 gene